MRKTTLLLGLAFAVTTLSGCDDDATKVCKKMVELGKKSEKEDAKKASDEEIAKVLEECKKKAAEEQKKDPEAFKKMSDCIMGVSDMDGYMKCAMEAEGDKKDDDKKEDEAKE